MTFDDLNNVPGEKGITDGDVREPMRHFAGRIVHDLNNLLTPLLAYPALVRHDIPETSQSAQLIDVIEESAEIMASLAERLAAFALPYNASKYAVGVDETIRSVLTEFEDDEMAYDIVITDDLAAHCSVYVPRDALMEVLRALILNAIEAMRGKGRLHVCSSPELLAEPLSTQSATLTPGEYVRLTVQDAGPGMQPEVQSRAFEPFFTTRKHAKARGAGLGLSIVLSVIADCGGAIVFGEKSDAGFPVSVWFPVVPDEKDVDSDVDAIEPSAESLSVLIVDDEVPIVDLFKLMLESAMPGVDVDVAYNGREAVNAFTAKRYQVVIMDLHMPLMDGQAAFDALQVLCREKHWEMPCVVCCTGYAPPKGIQQVIEGSACHRLLKKPVKSDDLLEAVRNCLEANR